MSSRIITLTTDFGLRDPFVGLMKGVILSINTDARVVDITHHITRHNIFEASQVISMSYAYFPPATIHIVVVDPGVGGTRRPIMVLSKDHCFIGPDNGTFTPLFYEKGVEGMRVIHLTSSHHFLKTGTSTFHGRDIFAPVAAWFSKGIQSSMFGDEITDYVKIPSLQVEIEEGNRVEGAIIYIDHFGNAFSNIKKGNIDALQSESRGREMRIYCKEMHAPLVDYYEEPAASMGDLLSIINSFGLLELYVFRDSAARKCNISVGDKVSVMLA